MKNSLDRLKKRKFSELKDRSIEITYSKEQREKKLR